MSIHPDMEKWKQRFFFCLVLALGTLFLTGARHVTHDINHRPERIEQMDTQVREWGRVILNEGLGNRVDASVSPQQALFLVKACTHAEDAPRQ